MPDTNPHSPNAWHSTGPITPLGKANSSRNAIKHGCCAKLVVLPGESEEEFNDLLQGWLDDYDPDTQTGLLLVSHAAEAEWVRMRNVSRYHQCEKKLCEESDFTLWSEAQHHQLQLALRYRTAAERSFSKAFNNLERLRGSRLREAAQHRRELEREKKLEKHAKPVTEPRPPTSEPTEPFFSDVIEKPNPRRPFSFVKSYRDETG